METLKEKARDLKPMIRIGKAGLTPAVINEINMQLKKKKLIKIKLLKSVLQDNKKEEIRDEIVKRTGSRLVSSIGFVITLHKS